MIVDDALGRNAADPLRAALGEFRHRVHKEPLEAFNNPHKFDVCFGQDPQNGRIHALVYTGASFIDDNRSLVTAWEQLPEVEEYAFWDNSDPLDYVTSAEWKQRRSAWVRVLPDTAVPAENMLQFTLRCSATMGLELMFVPERRAELRGLVERARERLSDNGFSDRAWDLVLSAID